MPFLPLLLPPCKLLPRVIGNKDSTHRGTRRPLQLIGLGDPLYLYIGFYLRLCVSPDPPHSSHRLRNPGVSVLHIHPLPLHDGHAAGVRSFLISMRSTPAPQFGHPDLVSVPNQQCPQSRHSHRSSRLAHWQGIRLPRYRLYPQPCTVCLYPLLCVLP